MVSVGKEKMRGGILPACFANRSVQNFQNALTYGLHSINFFGGGLH